MAAKVLLIACGALAREMVLLTRQNNWQHLKVRCLPADLHNTPSRIPAAVVAVIEAEREQFEHMFVAYADCGTGGQLDKALAPYAIERLPGAHCYEMFAAAAQFTAFCEAEPGTFYLTDFLVRNFERLVIKGLGIDRHPQLRDDYFRHYKRLTYLSQTNCDDLRKLAKSYAARLGLGYAEHFTGLASAHRVLREHAIRWQN